MSIKTKVVAVMATAAMLIVPMMNEHTPYTGRSISIVSSLEASAASVRYGSSCITGCFNNNDWSGWTSINPNNTRNTAKVRVCAFKQNGKIESGKFKVDIFSRDWQYCGTKWITGSGTLYLNYGYNGYKIRFRRDGYGPTNVSRTQYWSVEAKSNIYSMFRG